MADERELAIKISAKNLTEAEFKKVRSGLDGIAKESEQATTKAGGLHSAFSSFAKGVPGALKIVTGAAVATGAAVGVVAAAVMELGKRGAMVADVRDAFGRLSGSVGETADVMLGALSQGVKGTISNFELMQLANKPLGAGLLKSAEDAKTLAEGARMLAKRTGTDTPQAFETLTTAMASGRTAQLKQLGLFVDSKKAVEDYAAAQGRTVSSLTDVDRATALQVATMIALRGELERNAPPLADFGEIIEQGRSAVKNLVDGLAVMISQSPPILAGMNAVKDALSKAFGGEQTGLVLGITNAIEKSSLMVIEFGKLAISTAEFTYKAFSSIKVIVIGLAQALSAPARAFAEFAATVLETAASIPVIGAAYEGAAGMARTAADATDAYGMALQGQMESAVTGALGIDTFGRSLSTAKGILDEVGLAMTNAGLSQQDLNMAVAEGTTQNYSLVTTGDLIRGVFGEQLPSAMIPWQETLGETKENVQEWEGLTTASFLHAKEVIENEFGAGHTRMSLDVVANNAMTARAFEDFGITTRAESEATLKKMEADFKRIKDSGLASARDIEAAEKKLNEYRRTVTGETTSFMTGQNTELVSDALGSFAQLGGSFKIFAVAQAVISTYLSIAKSLANYPWPMSLVAAAAAGVAGWANVSKIKSSAAYATGTPGLDFAEFGRESPALLHGSEAVIPRGGGHMLAEEIARAMGRTREPSRIDALLERGFDRIGSKLDGLPRSIQRAVRDGMLLAT